MITTPSRFQNGSLHIPNAVGAVGNIRATSAGIDMFIYECERDLLTKVIGKAKFDLIKAYVDADEPDSVDWIDHLLDGHTYELEGVSKHFLGLKDNQSCLPYFIYNKYLNGNYDSMGVNGMQIASNSAAIQVDPTPKDVETWNDFVDRYQGKTHSGVDSPVIRHYASGTLIDYYAGNVSNDADVDLLTFLTDYESLNEGTYETLNNVFYEQKNSFGL